MFLINIYLRDEFEGFSYQSIVKLHQLITWWSLRVVSYSLGDTGSFTSIDRVTPTDHTYVLVGSYSPRGNRNIKLSWLS